MRHDGRARCDLDTPSASAGYNGMIYTNPSPSGPSPNGPWPPARPLL